MGSKSCMNQLCRATTSSEWKKGWILKSGGFATLCHNCGSAYENSIFCETFHLDESGWRECKFCGKLVHCGCIASRYLHEYMDFGGISCTSCSKRSEIHSLPSIQSLDNISSGKFVPKSGIRDANPIVVKNRIEEDKFSTERLMQLTNAIGVNNITSTLDKFKREEPIPKFPNTSQHSSSVFAKDDNKSRSKSGVKDMFESLAQPSTNFSLTVPFAGQKIVEGSEPSKGADSEHGTKTRHIFPRPPKPTPLGGSETNKGAVSQVRVARPPVDGRGRNQLLPRYWPRITDQELQQLSGDLKSTIVPLFEKILSASDAGRIGRLVLPKACAEAYFPSINQSEGIPIKIQDIKGKEWIFQFRFWPNNNSRMYVLEGVTPCIQNMQLQAGDTVIFSRIDPGGQLVIGCRKATNNVDVQEPQTSTFPNDSPGETPVSANLLSNGVKASDDSLQQHLTLSEKKKARNIKNKRLLVNNNEAMDLRVTWDEAQELFRPSPSADRTVFVIEDQEFEEFEEPPVFGKRTVFVSGPSGEQEQVAQCDSCSKWRRLPVDALVSANWTCSDNIWDSTRCSCSAPEDINSKDLDMFGVNKDYKKRRISSGEGEPSGLDALANAAVLGGDNIGDMGEYAVEAAATTTRHPRHRPGCTCIVCIQPPSGKGKHEPTCKCNVCLTVRRRFKTLMMRKKKRQSDREAELELALEKMGTTTNNNNNSNDNSNNDNNNNNNNNNSNSNSLVGAPPPTKLELESEDIVGKALVSMNYQREENEGQNGNKMDLEETSKGQELDLNCDPRREDEVLLEEASGMSLTALMNAATFPLDVYSVPQASNALEENVVGVESEKNRKDG